jgi:ABC-type Fe3+-siderophore transport system permease subunit
MITELNILLMLVCALLGIGGQAVRSFIGFYKIYHNDDVTLKQEWKWLRFFSSLLMGAVIGALLGLIYKEPLSNTDVLGIIAASYGGADFLEGFLQKRAETVK